MADLAALRSLAVRWYRRHGRDLPWRRARDPYAILVSEAMLQQTQVDRVVPKYLAFLRRFPTVQSLAAARLADVLEAWSGLGYNGRARRLWECARLVTRRDGGRLPSNVDELRALPGIGPYTAAAIAAFAFEAREAPVDTNVRRVLARAVAGRNAISQARAQSLARSCAPRNASAWTQGLMDVGARWCRTTPECNACPLRRVCAWTSLTARQRRRRTTPPAAVKRQPYAGSRREHRGRAVRALAGVSSLSLAQLGAKIKEGFRKSDLPWLRKLLADLERDGLVQVDARRERARLP